MCLSYIVCQRVLSNTKTQRYCSLIQSLQDRTFSSLSDHDGATQFPNCVQVWDIDKAYEWAIINIFADHFQDDSDGVVCYVLLVSWDCLRDVSRIGGDSGSLVFAR